MKPLNFHFTSGHADFLAKPNGDRRFVAIKLPEPDLYRACALCSHQLVRHGVRGCAHPELLYRGVPLPIERQRARDGACGPEATRASASWAQA